MRYEGDDKLWTRDCSECPYRTDATCRWGVYVKILFQRDEKPRACEFRFKEPPERSAWRAGRQLAKKRFRAAMISEEQGVLFK